MHMLSAFSYPVFVHLFEPASRSDCFPDCVQEAREEMSLANGQSGAEEDDSNCIQNTGYILYTTEEELELTDDQIAKQTNLKPGALREICEKKIRLVGKRLAPGENLEDYVKELPTKLQGLCIISRLALTCDVGSGTYPFGGQVEKMSTVELFINIVWLHV